MTLKPLCLMKIMRYERTITMGQYHSDKSLLDLLETLRVMKTTIASDKIYGILGLITNHKHNITVDYSKVQSMSSQNIPSQTCSPALSTFSPTAQSRRPVRGSSNSHPGFQIGRAQAGSNPSGPETYGPMPAETCPSPSHRRRQLQDLAHQGPAARQDRRRRNAATHPHSIRYHGRKRQSPPPPPQAIHIGKQAGSHQRDGHCLSRLGAENGQDVGRPLAHLHVQLTLDQELPDQTYGVGFDIYCDSLAARGTGASAGGQGRRSSGCAWVVGAGCGWA